MLYTIMNAMLASNMKASICTAQDGVRGNISDLHSSDARFESRAVHWLFGFCDIPRSLQANDGNVSHIKPYLFCPTSLPYRFSPIILQFITL
jgi:hypothetical protein